MPTRFIKSILYVALAAFGVFLIVYGEGDDSPGAQFLGLLAVVAGIVYLVKNRKK